MRRPTADTFWRAERVERAKRAERAERAKKIAVFEAPNGIPSRFSK